MLSLIHISLDDEGFGVMEETVEESGGHGGVAGEDVGPVLKGDVGGDDGRAAFVAFADDLEEEFATALIEREVAEFVEPRFGVNS